MLGVSKTELELSFRWSEQIGEKFPECDGLARRLLLVHRRRYRKLARLNVLWFRVVGCIEVVLSVSLPVFFVFPIVGDEQGNYVFLAAISVLVAIAAALRNFYGWDGNWRLYRSQELILGTLLAQWEIALLKLAASTAEDAGQQALERTETLLDQVAGAFQHEHEALFNLVQPPASIRASAAPVAAQ